MALPYGRARELLKQIRQGETAANAEKWANSPELQRPK
jgi:hypothetical protein